MPAFLFLRNGLSLLIPAFAGKTKESTSPNPVTPANAGHGSIANSACTGPKGNSPKDSGFYVSVSFASLSFNR